MQESTRAMNAESAAQREVRQEKNKYCVAMHICGIQENDPDEPSVRAGTETEMCGRSGEGRGWDEFREQLSHIHTSMGKTDSESEAAV